MTTNSRSHRPIGDKHAATPPACLAILGMILCATAGCTHVAPYEREALAHPTMSSADLTRPSEEHVRAVQEGAVGGGFAAGGGCGCN